MKLQRYYLPLATPVRDCHTIVEQPKRSDHAQRNWQRLLGLDCSRDAGSGQHDRREEGQLDTVRLSILDSVAAESVQGADAAAGDKRGYGAGADVLCGISMSGFAEVETECRTPVIPPPAVKPARMYAIWLRDCGRSLSYQSSVRVWGNAYHAGRSLRV